MYILAFSLSLILLIGSVPIFLVFGLGSSVAAIGGLNLPWSVLVQVSFGALTKHVLIAVPLFIFAGMAMLKGGRCVAFGPFRHNFGWPLAGWAWHCDGDLDGFFCRFLWLNSGGNHRSRHHHDAKDD